MTTVSIEEAQARFPDLLQRAQMGEDIVIARDGKAVAVLVRCIPPGTERRPGFDKGRIWMSDDADAPLPDELLDAFEGRS